MSTRTIPAESCPPNASQPTELTRRKLLARFYESLIQKMPPLPDDADERARWRASLHEEASALADQVLADGSPPALTIVMPPRHESLLSVLNEPEKGKPLRSWVIGTNQAGDYVCDVGGESPHLLVVGGFGSGKSRLLDVLLCQLMHNSHPDDVRVWLAEPKNTLHRYRQVEHVERFIDCSKDDFPPHELFGALMQEAVFEMRRRYKLMTTHPRRPMNIEEARKVASDSNDPADSQLMFPYIYIFIEESAFYFDEAESRQHGYYCHIETLFRQCRAAGISVVLATQWANKGAPGTVKHQSRHICFPVTSNSESRKICGNGGLERLTRPEVDSPGCGVWSYDPYVGDPATWQSFRTLEAATSTIDEIVAALPTSERNRMPGALTR